ncbi:MAG: carboxylating nicotinate-nucleotide diphosphorylase [Candidatus Thioglobus sp.]|nr:MAG: carboxylating nicotinate-nucleotide diphosphorylase [Candidatus Thioglobus sp.]
MSVNKVADIVANALKEDIGTGDVSANLLDDKSVSAQIIARQQAVVCGIEYAQTAFLLLDNTLQINWHFSDGDTIRASQVLCTLSGGVKGIISAERVALNFLQTLCAVATQTKRLVSKIAHTNAQLLDTRKTLPGLRLAQKYAVRCGGGVNHRLGLFDALLLKENHIIAAGSIAKAVELAKEKHLKLPLIVEVENLAQLGEALDLTGISRVLCDNFSINDLAQAVKMADRKLLLEASGNIDDSTIVQVAETGVDYISTGAITKNIAAIDLSLRFT